ncbi:hypothetical protein J1N35_044708 [Gossypium stocksii]|uniref:Uncharacterized protein n=1 Tax=Gossypium stocksii TaxID=47602 RepID=A0A9D3U9W8_9ROSI|nr:hypothetical protein J1N35_044708 [Gossypium stocksii]
MLVNDGYCVTDLIDVLVKWGTVDLYLDHAIDVPKLLDDNLLVLRGENQGGNIDVNNVEIELVRHEDCVYHDRPGKSTIVERVYEVDDEHDIAERVNNIESGDTLLFDVECLSENEDEEIRGIKTKLKQYKQKKKSNIGNDLEDLYSPNAIVNDGVETARIEGHLKVSDGAVNDGFSKGMDSDDHGDYDSDVQSDDEFSVRSVGPKYDANCIQYGN